MLKKICCIGIVLSLSACNKVDNYLLGEDNTLKPKELKPLKSKNLTQLQEKWSLSAGSGKKSNGYLKLKPVVQDKTVYAADASGLISVVSAADGKLLWSKQLKEGLISGPALGQGYLLVGTDSSKIIALSKDTGQELWQAGLSGDALAKPLIAQNKAIIKTIDGNIYAFDLKTGKQVWLSEHGAPSLILKTSSSPVMVDNKIILVGHSDGKMDAINIETGQLLWQKSIAFAQGSSDVERLVDIDADPIVQGDKVLLATYQGYIGALSLQNGEFIWRKPASTYSNIVAKGDSIFMTDSNDVVWSINKQTGLVNWKQLKLKARGLTEPSIMGDRIVFGDKTGMLHVLSTQTGECIGRAELGGGIMVSPSVSGNSVYVMSANGKLSRYAVG